MRLKIREERYLQFSTKSMENPENYPSSDISVDRKKIMLNLIKMGREKEIRQPIYICVYRTNIQILTDNYQKGSPEAFHRGVRTIMMEANNNIMATGLKSNDHKIFVLYVDDEPDLLDLGRLYLERLYEFKVDTMTSAINAMKSPQTPLYDAIISDYQMPGMDGIEFLKSVREQFGAIPFILFTGRGREEVVIEAINNGADFYIQKGGEPIPQFMELSHKIKQAVRRKKAEDAVISSESRLRSFLEATSEAVSLIDEEGKVIEWNVGSERITGIPAEYALGRHIRDLNLQMVLLGHQTEDIRYYQEHEILMSFNTDIPVFKEPRFFKVVNQDGKRLFIRRSIFSIKTDKGFRIGSLSLDVTTEKIAENALRESEERFRSMAERSSDLIIIVDQNFRVTYASPSAPLIIGYDPEELTGTSKEFAASKIFPQSVSELLKVIQKLQTGETVPNLEMRVKKKDGTPIYVNLCAVPIMQNGVFIGAQSSWRVISNDKTIIRALRESEERFRHLVENANEIVYILTRDGTYSYISPRITDLLGYESHEVIGTHASKFIHPDDYLHLRELFLTSINTGNGFDGVETRALHKDGTYRWLSGNFFPIRSDEGDIESIHGICHDFTERRIAEDALRKSELKLRINKRKQDNAMELANLVNWEYDIINDVFIFNDRFYALYGTTAEQEGGYLMSPSHYAREFIHPDDMGKIAEIMEKSKQSIDPNYISKIEHRIIRRDGETRHILVRGSMTKDPDCQDLLRYGANQDITENKKNEEALKKANSQLNLLSCITRHDILNKVNLVRIFLDDAQMICTDTEISQRLKKIESAIESIQTEIEFTRVYEELGSHEPQWTLLDSVMPLPFLPNSVTLFADVQGISIFADPMLKKVFFDLLDNSIRHGQRVSEVRVSTNSINDNLIVIWEDNGIGINKGEKELIFNRGFGKNTGFGMFLVREILSLTGITILENGIPGEGARFIMTVPRGMFQQILR